MGRHPGGIADCAEILSASMIFHKKTSASRGCHLRRSREGRSCFNSSRAARCKSPCDQLDSFTKPRIVLTLSRATGIRYAG
jgi:hypothetical protein